MTEDVWMSLGVVVLLILISAFFSGSETGLTAASRARLTEMERRGSKRAGIVLKLTETPERLIGALLLGNSLANITASAVATVALVKAFGDTGAFIASAVMTVLILIFAEVMPKTYAIAYPDRFATLVAPLVRLVVAVLGPIVMMVEYIVKITLRLFGADVENVQSILSAHEELRGAIDLHHKEGEMVKKDRDMLGGILDLKDLEVHDVMIHRTKMITFDAGEPTVELVNEVLKSGKTRLPVWRDSPDNIIGVLHAKNLFKALQEHDGDASKIKLENILTDPWFVPDTRPLEDQLNAFLRRKSHFAIVVDEYGEVQGLITLEDIIEEIVGDIKDEFDAVSNGVRKQKDGSFMIDGSVALRDLNRALEWSLPDEEATTLAGLVIHEARMIPDAGQVFNFHGFRFEVLKKRKQQITVLKVARLDAPGAAPAQEG
ncbi:MAG: HlyC/CorC family transporter [Alphaproteobacteria bacterium]|nr:HlyC/CorC family transporter [Alphaproteobacteria bacterium]